MSAPRPQSAQGQMTLDELEQLTRVFADLYLTTIASACDALERRDITPEQRRIVSQFRASYITSIYDIVTNPDPFTQLVDLLLVVSLQSRVWIDEGYADVMLGEHADLLVIAIRRVREKIWEIAARVMRPEQLEEMDFLIWDWRRVNPDVHFVGLVRFGDFAAARGRSVLRDVQRGSGLLAPVGDAQRALDETRLFAERVFFLAKRTPILLSWQTEHLAHEILTIPSVETALREYSVLADNAQRLVNLIETLPDVIATEREATLGAIDDRTETLAHLLSEFRAAVQDTDRLVVATQSIADSSERIVAEFRAASEALGGTIAAGDALVGRFDTGGRQREPAAAFDLDRYTRATAELTAAARELRLLLETTERTLESDALTSGLTGLNTTIGAHLDRTSSDARGLIRTMFWRVAVLLGLAFVLACAFSVFHTSQRRRAARVGAGKA